MVGCRQLLHKYSAKMKNAITAASLEPLSREHFKFLILHLTLYFFIQDYSLSFIFGDN
jgi:hypothetical protein